MQLQITNPDRIRSVLRSLQSSRREGWLFLAGEPVGRSGVEVWGDSFRLTRPAPADTLVIEGWSALYELRLRRGGRGFRLPRSLLLRANRRDRRLRLEATATADGREVEVLDLSWRGAGLRGAPPHFDELVLRIEDEEYPVRHTIVWRREDELGVRLEEDEDYRDAIGDHLHPWTTSERPAPQALWEALKDWYFQIRGPGQTGFAAIREAWEQVLNRNVRFSRSAHVVLHREHWATLSFLNLYSRTWIGHQLGALRKLRGLRDRGASERIKRDLYAHCFERAQMHMSDEPWWVMGSCRSASWLTRHWDFARSIESLGGVNLSILPVEIPTAVFLKDFDRRTDCAVSRVDEDPDAMALLFESLERSRPAAWREAFDLVPERYDLEEARARLAQDGLELHRRTFFARDGDRPLVAMVLEIATRGVNAFRLFDCVRFVDLVPDLPDADRNRARHALTVAAYDFFRGERDVLDDGRRDYFVVNIEESGHVGIPAFFQHFENHEPLGHGFSWVIPSASVPAFLERIWESTPLATDAPPPQPKDVDDDHLRPHADHPLAHPDLSGTPPEPGRRRGDPHVPGRRRGDVAG